MMANMFLRERRTERESCYCKRSCCFSIVSIAFTIVFDSFFLSPIRWPVDAVFKPLKLTICLNSTKLTFFQPFTIVYDSFLLLFERIIARISGIGRIVLVLNVFVRSPYYKVY